MKTDFARYVTPSRQMLEAALIRIAERWKLSWINVADYKALGVIEGCAHELAHALDLGPDFEVSISAMEDGDANRREAATLRIEVMALEMLGVHLAMRRLRGSANWNGPVGIPTLSQLQAPLDPHERCCVRRFVVMVAKEVKSHPEGAL